MDKLHLLLYSSKENLEYTFISSDEDMLQEMHRVLMSKCSFDFSNSSWVRIINDDRTLSEIKRLQDKYEEQLIAVRKLFGFVSKLEKGEAFYCLFADNCGIAERKTAIECIQGDYDVNLWKAVHNHIYEQQKKLEALFEYHSFGFDGMKTYVGEKHHRVCRFCGETNQKKFSDRAHAIGDSLGNKKLFCYEECDTCNHTLNKIEDNFLHLMDIRRALYNISRKETTSSPSIYGNNFAILPNEKGAAELYIMQEAIDPNVDISKPFIFQLKQYAVLSDEKIYKALAKMVIDLIPSPHLPQFENTIKWIRSDSFIVDSLPEIWFCHNIGKMHQQPYLDIFLNSKNSLSDTPYCTAILYIYDIAYVFVMPLVDVDRGMFKYNKQLENHWQRLFSCIDFPHRELQTFSEDRPCYPWAFWDIDPANPHIHILPKSNSVFNRCKREKTAQEEVCFPDFSYNGITITDQKCKFECFYEGIVTDNDLCDITQHITVPELWLLPQEKSIAFQLSLNANDTTDSIHYYSYNLYLKFKFPGFSKYIDLQYKDNDLDSVSIDWHLRDYIFNVAMASGDYYTEQSRKGTPFEKCKLSKLINERRIIEAMEYFIPNTINSNYFVKVSDRLIHPIGTEEDVP